jgi:hypothetical protein
MGRESRENKMNTTASFDSSTLKMNSPLFWFTFLIPAAIIGLGINFILNPVGASAGYGIPIHDPSAFPFLWVKGIRDIFSGVVVLTFLFRGDRRTIAILYSLAVFGRRWVCHPAPSWLCAAHLHSLGNSAVHDDRCRVSSEKEVALIQPRCGFWGIQ